MAIALPGLHPLVQLSWRVLAVLERLLTAVGPVLPAFGFSRRHWDFSGRSLEGFNTKVLATGFSTI